MASGAATRADGDASAQGRDADAPSEVPAGGWKDILKRVMGQISDDNVGLMAGGVAYYAMMSLFPAIAATVMIYGIVADPQQVSDTLGSFLEALPSSASSLVETQLQDVASSSGGALGFGAVITILTSLWSASAGMKGLIGGINTAYDETETRSFVPLRGLAIGLTVAAIVGLLVSITLIAVLPNVLETLGLGALQPLVTYGRWPLLALLVMGGLAYLYKLAPDRDNPEFKWVTPGSIVATILWLLGSAAFSIYVSNFGSYDETYGALGGVIVLMLWLFLTGFIVLLGAELNAEAERQTAVDTTVGSNEPIGHRDADAADEVAAGTDTSNGESS